MQSSDVAVVHASYLVQLALVWVGDRVGSTDRAVDCRARRLTTDTLTFDAHLSSPEALYFSTLVYKHAFSKMFTNYYFISSTPSEVQNQRYAKKLLKFTLIIPK